MRATRTSWTRLRVTKSIAAIAAVVAMSLIGVSAPAFAAVNEKVTASSFPIHSMSARAPERYVTDSGDFGSLSRSTFSPLPMVVPTSGEISGHLFLGSSATPATSATGEVQFNYCASGPTGPNCSTTPTVQPLLAGGAYDITNAPFGYYTFNFVAASGQYYYPYSGIIVQLTSDNPVIVEPDVTLAPEASLSGTVHLGSGTQTAAAGDVTVQVVGQYNTAGGVATTDANGNYTVYGLNLSLFYTIYFRYNGSAGYASSYYGLPPGATTPAASQYGFESLIQLESEPGPFDVTLPLGGSVSGAVTTSSGAHAHASQQIQLNTLNSVGDVVATDYSRFTNSDGTYSISGLTPGHYSIKFAFNGFEGDNDAYAGASLSDPFQVDNIDVLPGQSITNENATEYLGSSVMFNGTCTNCATGLDATYALYNSTLQYLDPKSSSWVTIQPDVFYVPEAYFNVVLPGTYRPVLTLRTDPTNVTIGNTFAVQEGQPYTETLTATSPPPLGVAPKGYLAPITFSNGAIKVSGWGVDDDQRAAALNVEVQIDSTRTSIVANLDAGTTAPNVVVPGAGFEHGFSQSFPEPSGNHTVCVYLDGVGGGPTQIRLGCSTNGVTVDPAVAKFETATGSATGITVSGYSVWPDAPSTSVGVAINIGSNWYGLTANQTDAAAQSDTGAGPNHGFVGVIPASPGTYNACLWTTQPSGPSTEVSCLPVVVPVPGATKYKVDSTTGSGSGVSVSGYALFPDNDAASVGVAVNIGSGWYGLTANQPSSEATTDVPGAGPNHGFAGTIALPPGTYSACVWVTEPSGSAVNTGCHTVVVPAPARTTYGLDSITGTAAGVSVAGWALFPDTPATSVGIALNIGSGWYGLTANKPNSDAGAGTNHGYSGSVALAPGTYNVCVWVTEPSGAALNTGCHSVVVPVPARAVVQSDSVRGGVGSITVTGWDVFPDSLTTHVGMALNIGAGWYGLTANTTNAEVTTVYPAATADHGYADTLAMAPGTYNVCVWTTEPSGPAVNAGCHSVVVTAPHAAVSNIDSVTGGVGAVSVAGWDVFPDALSTQVGMAINIGSGWYALSANTPNSESATAYPTPAVDHGFAGSVALKPGTYNVCLWTTEPVGPAVNIGCRTATVTAAPPAVTSYDTATAVTGGIQVTGYSQFPGTPATLVGVAAQIGSNWFGFTANGAATNATYTGHGFTGFIPASHGTYSVCMWTTEPAGAASVQFGCKSVVVP